MFTIYYIPEKNKVGCTERDVDLRVREQGFDYYEVLEIHEDKFIAGDREIELQKKYGTEIDKCKFYERDYKELGSRGGKNGYGYRPYNATEVIKMDKQGNKLAEYSTLYEAAKQNNIHRSNISNCCLGKRKTAGGYKWKYK